MLTATLCIPTGEKKCQILKKRYILANHNQNLILQLNPQFCCWKSEKIASLTYAYDSFAFNSSPTVCNIKTC